MNIKYLRKKAVIKMRSQNNIKHSNKATRPMKVLSVRILSITAISLGALLGNQVPAYAQSTTTAPKATQSDTLRENFDSWKQTFKIDALAAGITSETYDREMATVFLRAQVKKANNNQPEFTRAVWGYIDGAVSAARVQGGRQNHLANKAKLAAIETQYGVDQEVIVAIWGLESSFGKIQGDHDALSALATLAYEGRRTYFGRTQLISALKIIQNGYATRKQLKGSWAGAMGQTQFIPTTYLDYAIDQNNDGKRDLWSDLDDVFASTANYLKRSGYQKDAPWGVEIALPDNFDYAQADKSNRKLVVRWAASGIKKANGQTLISDNIDINAKAYIIIPAGAQGPAFMVFDNFKAILKYNNSTSYALGIGMLSDQIAGRSTQLVNDWPRTDRPLSLTQRKLLQQLLTDKGYEVGPIDGIIGAGTRKALRAWQKDNNLAADGYASLKVLGLLQQNG